MLHTKLFHNLIRLLKALVLSAGLIWLIVALLLQDPNWLRRVAVLDPPGVVFLVRCLLIQQWVTLTYVWLREDYI